MGNTALWVGGLIVAGLVVAASGIRLTVGGAPFGSLMLNVHKLIDLAAIIAIGVMLYGAHGVRPLTAAEWAVVAVGVLLVVAALVSGGLSSAMQPPPRWVVWLHRLGSIGAIALAVACTWLAAVRV